MANGQGHARVAHPGSSLSPPGKVRFLFHAANAPEIEVFSGTPHKALFYQVLVKTSPK
jgi:hypothetical protein